MIELFDLVPRLAGHMDAEALVELDILLRDDNGEMCVAAAQAAELLLRELGDGVRQRGDAQRDEHLVRVQARVVVAEALDLQLRDRLDDLCGDEVETVVHAALCLERVEQQRRARAEQRAGLSRDHAAVRQHHRAGRLAGLLGLSVRGGDGRADVGRDICLPHHQLELAQLALVRLAACDSNLSGVVAAQDLQPRCLAADLVGDDAVARHVHAHVGRGLIGARPLDFFKYRAQHGKDLHIAVVVDGRDAIGLKVEGIDHVHIVEVGGRRLIGEVDGVLERQVPNGEGLELRIARRNAVFVLVVELGEAGGHLAAAGSGRSDDDERVRGLDVVVPPEALVADDVGNIRGIARDGVVTVVLHAERIEALQKGIGGGLAGILRDHDAADIQPQRAESVHQTQAVVVVADTEVTAQLVLFNVVRADRDHDLHIVAQLLEHADLAVGLKTGQHTRGMKVVKELAAELQIQFPAEERDALANMLRLH